MRNKKFIDMAWDWMLLCVAVFLVGSVVVFLFYGEFTRAIGCLIGLWVVTSFMGENR